MDTGERTVKAGNGGGIERKGRGGGGRQKEREKESGRKRHEKEGGRETDIGRDRECETKKD